MVQPDLSIVIVHWKVRRLLERCLQSLQKYRAGLNLEIFVVDNDSCDGTSEMLMVEHMDVVCIALPRNIGFAAAGNLGIKQSQAEYVLLLNPDTEIRADTLATMLQYMKENQSVGILGPKILNSDGSVQLSVRKMPGLWSQILTLLKLQNVLADKQPLERYLSGQALRFFSKLRSLFSHSHHLSDYLQTNFNYNQAQSVEQVMGAAMLIRRKLIEQIGLLDQGFFIWFEEVDYCWRAKQAGWSVVYLPQATVQHQGGASFDQSSVLRKQLIFDRSLLYFFWKNKPLWQFLIILLLVPLNLFLTMIYAAVKQDDQDQ